MDLRETRRHERTRPSDTAGSNDGTGNAAEPATRLADFAERVIADALSESSESFLRDRRQQGGQ